MEISHICPFYYPHIGGIETVVKEISEKFVINNNTVNVLTYNYNNKLSEYSRINNVNIFRFRKKLFGLDFFNNDSLLSYLLRNKIRSEIIHIHNYHDFPSLYALNQKNKKNKLIFSPHYHGSGHDLITNCLEIPYKFIGKNIYKKSDLILCGSRYEKNNIIKNFNIKNEKIIVQNWGVNLEKINDAKAYNTKDDLLLCVGRIEEHKNIHYIIKSLQYLPDNYILLIIGDGKYKNNLFQLINKLNLNRRIYFIPFVEENELYRWYKSCKLFINLSKLESFGLTVIEALAAKKHVLTSKNSALEDFKYLPNVTNIDTTISSQELASIIINKSTEKINKININKYSWNNVANNIMQIYNNMI